MKTISGIAVLAAAFLLWGCFGSVDLGLDSSRQEYVLNCILNPGQDTVTAWFSKSRAAASGETFDTVAGAEITLYENGENVGRFARSDSSAYILPFSAAPGKSYKIEATAEGKLVWGETRVPSTILADIGYASGIKGFSITFTDNAEEDNYYWISATGYERTVMDTTRKDTLTYIMKKNISFLLRSNFEYADDFDRNIFQDEDYHYEYDYYIRFFDAEIQGKETEVAFKPEGLGYPVEIFLLSADYHLDKYMKSSLLLLDMDLKAEEVPVMYAPFPMYSNINGGTGIFGSFSSASKIFTRN